jgi:hypothetical protein
MQRRSAEGLQIQSKGGHKVINWLFLVPIGTDWYRFFFDRSRASTVLSTDRPISNTIMVEMKSIIYIYAGQ